MPSVNIAILLGRLGKDPELKYTSSGKAVVSFSLATEDRFKGADGEQKVVPVWHNCVAWEKQAEAISEHLKKGSLVHIEGRISNRSYDAADGSGKRYVSEVVVESIQFLDKKTEQ